MLRRSGPSCDDSEREPLISGEPPASPPPLASEKVDARQFGGTSSCRKHLQTSALFFGALVSGCCAVLQTLLNSPMTAMLEKKLKPPAGDFAAGTISFGITTIIMMAVLSLTQLQRCCTGAAPPKFDPSANLAIGRFRWLVYGAGLFGAAHIVLKMIAAPVIGLSESYLWVTVGQQLSSLTLEASGVGSGQRMKVTGLRMCCVSLVLIGALLSVTSTSSKKMGTVEFRMIALAFLGGLCHPMQSLLNKLCLPAFGNDGLVLTLFNFVVGLVPLALLWFVSALGFGTLYKTGLALSHVTVLDVLGGVSFALFMVLNIVITQFLDINAFFIGTATGKLLLSLLLDANQFERGMPRVPISWSRLTGVLLAMLGTVALACSDFISEWLNARKKRGPPQQAATPFSEKEERDAHLQDEQDYTYGKNRSPHARRSLPSLRRAHADDDEKQEQAPTQQEQQPTQQEQQPTQQEQEGERDGEEAFAHGNH